MADRGKKERKTKIQKFEYLKKEKSFLDEIQSIFHSFLKGYQKIADISFKEKCQVREEVLETL